MFGLKTFRLKMIDRNASIDISQRMFMYESRRDGLDGVGKATDYRCAVFKWYVNGDKRT